MEQFQFGELNPLQIFLLVFVEFGLATPYDLLTKAGLGPGLTSPALKRLEEAGFVTSTPGPRKRLKYAITETGANQLRESFQLGDYWQFGQRDVFESLPRGIILAWLNSGVDEAHYGAGRAADSLLNLARRRQRESEELRGSMLRLQADILKDDRPAAKGLLIATAYQWLKAESDAALYRVQAEAIGEINKSLVDLPPAHLVQGDKSGVS
jgi:DNA-binding PadR family transcriptional regulator